MGLAWNIYAPLGTLSTFFFNPVFQVSTAKNEINLFNNHILIVAEAPVTFAPAGAMTPSAEFLFILKMDQNKHFVIIPLAYFGSVRPFVCLCQHPRFRRYFGHNYEVF